MKILVAHLSSSHGTKVETLWCKYYFVKLPKSIGQETGTRTFQTKIEKRVFFYFRNVSANQKKTYSFFRFLIGWDFEFSCSFMRFMIDLLQWFLKMRRIFHEVYKPEILRSYNWELMSIRLWKRPFSMVNIKFSSDFFSF